MVEQKKREPFGPTDIRTHTQTYTRVQYCSLLWIRESEIVHMPIGKNGNPDFAKLVMQLCTPIGQSSKPSRACNVWSFHRPRGNAATEQSCNYLCHICTALRWGKSESVFKGKLPSIRFTSYVYFWYLAKQHAIGCFDE